MNHIAYDFLLFLDSTFSHWKENFKTNPIVYIGIGRPQHKLTTNQRFIASLGVTILGAVTEYFLDAANAEDEDTEDDLDEAIDDWEDTADDDTDDEPSETSKDDYAPAVTGT